MPSSFPTNTNDLLCVIGNVDNLWQISKVHDFKECKVIWNDLSFDPAEWLMEWILFNIRDCAGGVWSYRA